MAREIIDINRYLKPTADEAGPAGTMALWGADGERSRFALPLWRVAQLAEAERAVIFWRHAAGDGTPQPFVVLDLGQDPARVDVASTWVARCEGGEEPRLTDLRAEGVIIHLGARDQRSWFLLADGGGTRMDPLEPRKREDILFLAGECAGLLFLRDFAGGAEGGEEKG